MINRKIDKKIEQFYANHAGALLLTGARQVGKTFAMRKFAKEHFKNVVEINFVENPQAIGAFDGASDASEMLFRLSALTSVKFPERHSCSSTRCRNILTSSP